MIRVRRCLVRAIVRQPWLFADPDVLSAALTRLAADVIAPRLAGQLGRVSQEAPLTTVALRVTLPAQVVLGLADEAAAGSGGRHLASFGAELAVHAAISGAVRSAVERQEPDGPDRVPPSDSRPQPASAAGSARPLTPPGPKADALAAAASGRLPAAVRGTLLAAWRLDRLQHLLERCDPALLTEWARLLSRQHAREPPAPAVAEGMPVGGTDEPPTGTADTAFEAILDVLAATADAWAGQLPPDAREAGRAAPPTETAGAGAAPLTPPGPGADALAVAAGGRLPAAVRGTLLAAWRLDRLRHLLERCDPALLTEWSRLLPVQGAREPAAPPATARRAGPEPSSQVAAAGPVATGPAAPSTRPGPPPPYPLRAGAAASLPGAAVDAAFEAIFNVLAATAAPGQLPHPRQAAAAAPRPGSAEAAFEAILDVLAATAAARQLPRPPRAAAAPPSGSAADTGFEAIPDIPTAAPGPGRLEPGR